jgi:hypothetical protein
MKTIKPVYSDTIVTQVGRVSYPYLVTPSLQMDKETKKYQLDLIFEPDADLTELKTAIKIVAQQAFPGVEASKLLLPLKKGDDKEDPMYQGRLFITPRSKDAPKYVNGKRELIDPEEIYAGCYARVMVTAGSFSMGSRGVALYLKAVQFVKDGERLSGAEAINLDDFGDIEGDDWSDDAISF